MTDASFPRLPAARRQRHRRGPAGQRGAIAVAFALVSVLLLGFVGFGTDIGRLYVSRTELQNAADACVLSASAALTGTSDNQLRQAEAWGIAAGSANRVGMQSTPAPMPLGSAVTFSATAQGSFAPASSFSTSSAIRAVQYVRCTVTETGIAPILTQVLNLLPGSGGIGSRSVTASATGGLRGSLSNCSLPVGICRKNTGAGHGLSVGDWVIGGFNNGTLGGQQSFYWVGFVDGTKVSDIDAQLSGNGQCALVNSDTTVVPHNGVVSALTEAWNMRFGLRRSNAGVPVLPDTTGYYYMPPTTLPPATMPPSRFQDFQTRRTSYASGSSVTTPPGYRTFTRPGGYTWMNTNQHRTLGSDRRMAISPIVDCDALKNGAETSVIEWGCLLLLHPIQNTNDPLAMEYRGYASDPLSGCQTAGLPGANGPRVPVLTQ